MQGQGSILKRKKVRLAVLQLESDSFLQKNDLLIASDQKEREKAGAIRYQQLRQLKNILYIDNKIFYNGIGSINCQRCSHGETVAFHLTNYCTRNCFFCPQKRTSKTITLKGLTNFSPTKDHDLWIIQGIECFDGKGCGLTGGEPLVVVDKVLHYIKLLKNKFGSQFWIHLYTNGDLLTPENLRGMQKVGLDEIRFNLAANGYDINTVAMTKQYIPKVMVEIPVIPEDKQKVKHTMTELERIGIEGINLHELTISLENASKMKERGYKARKNYKIPFYLGNEVPVYLSEETIFDLIEFAVEQDFSYSVHYCTISQRIFAQNYSRSYRTAMKCHRPYETVTEQGLLEKLVVPVPGISAALGDLEKNCVPKEQIHVSQAKQRLETHCGNLGFLSPSEYEVRIIKCLPEENFSEVYIGDQIA